MNSSNLKGLLIHATDGELGSVEEMYFDDETWAIRYFVVETGGWLGGRRVLISPYSVVRADWQGKRLDVALTKIQLENSPKIDIHLPVSRQHEAEFLGYYGYPNYWGGPYMWGPAFYPAGIAVPDTIYSQVTINEIRSQSLDSHLRSTEAVTGYHLEATDGEIGHLKTFIVDDAAWAIRYLEVATQNWWPGKTVLFAPAWVESVSWVESKVFVALSKEAIRNAPEYSDSMPVTRDYEHQLYEHYGRPPYWLGAEARKNSALAMTAGQ